jgi:2-haloacid dehalogenase
MSGRYKPFWEITRDALRFSAARLGLGLDEAAEGRLMGQYASLSAFPENLDVLRALHAGGLALGILSNGNRDMIEVSIRSAGMNGLFAHVLSSEQVGTFKTMSAVYDLVPQALGCPAERVLFVSSNGWDAIAARWYGFTSFWINRDGAPLDVLDTEPNFVGARLNDVAAIALNTHQS